MYSSYLQLEVARTVRDCQRQVPEDSNMLTIELCYPDTSVLFLNIVLGMVLVSWLFLQECRRWHSTEPVTVQRASRVLLSTQWFSVHVFPARQRNVFRF